MPGGGVGDRVGSLHGEVQCIMGNGSIQPADRMTD